jgi:hypothetical protein
MKNKKTNGLHKLLSPWECPFIVAKVIGPSTYKLMTEDGIEVQKYVAYQPTKKILRLKNSFSQPDESERAAKILELAIPSLFRLGWE